MKPTIGRIVVYNTTEEQRKQQEKINAENNKTVANIQKQLPAIIVAVWGDDETSAVNLKVLKDGEGEIWATSCSSGDGEGQWNWPPRV